MDDAKPHWPTHDLLLALAGRVDDDLLNWARELVALGEDARAVEMLTASLVAARAVLPTPVRSALVAAARTDFGPAAALPQAQPEDGTEHRFATPDDEDPVACALRDLPPRPLTGCSVLLTRRLTPAGTAPGPLPHPVVLIRLHDGARPADMLAYQLGAALERAGATASVEVLPTEGPVPGYHAAALDSAVELRVDEADHRSWRPDPPPKAEEPLIALPAAPPPQPERPAERHALAPPVEQPVRRSTDPAERPVRDHHPFGRPDDPDLPTGDELFRANTPVMASRRPDADSAHPDRVPAGADQATAQLAIGPARGHRLDDDHDHDDYQEDHQDDDEDGDREDYDDDYRDEDYQDEVPDSRDPAEEPFQEPLSPHPLAPPRPMPPRDQGPPRRPIPLPGGPPTGTRQRPAVTPISRPAPANPIPMDRRNGPNPIPRPAVRRGDLEPPVDGRPERPAARRPEPRPIGGEAPPYDPPFDPLNDPLHQPLLAPLLDPTRPEDGPPAPGSRPSGPEDSQDDEWSEDWLSGTWAMAPSALEEPTEQELEPADDVEPDLRSPRPVPRHRYTYEQEPTNGIPGPERGRPDDAGDEPADRDVADGEQGRSDLGLRPESIARLSDADRQLLARLQAELLQGRRQRLGGRRIINGSAAPTNGHRGPPPDLAG